MDFDQLVEEYLKEHAETITKEELLELIKALEDVDVIKNDKSLLVIK